jgi:hypothetical protein
MIEGFRFRGEIMGYCIPGAAGVTRHRRPPCREKTGYEEALAAGKVESAEVQRLLIREVIADNAAGFAATLGVRVPKLYIWRIVCPDEPVWELLDWRMMTLPDLVCAMGAREITRLLLGFFDVIPTGDSLRCPWASGDEEPIREIWFHTPEEMISRRLGAWLRAAGALQLEVPFRWLLGLASDLSLERAVELLVEDRLVWALCEVEATGFDLTRPRPARALSRWGRTMSFVTTPTPSLPSVPVSTLFAWHVGTLRSWVVPCDRPEADASGLFEWADPTPRIDLVSLTRVLAKRVLFLGQTQSGVLFGFFAYCEPSSFLWRSDPDLKSSIFVLEHPTGEQRKWRVRIPCAFGLNEEFLWFGPGFGVDASGHLHCGPTPEFGMTEGDVSFLCLDRPIRDGWSRTQVDRWELWVV